MNIHNVKMDVAAVKSTQWPDLNIPEIALAGRSNVGKSSLINKVLNRRNFARVSASPGKTATINFYNIDDCIHLVDLPGYGYAKVSKQEKEKWADMIAEYLAERQQLQAVFQLVDMRHKPTQDDVAMLDWIRANDFQAIVVATKHDKLKPSKIEESLAVIRDTLKLTEEDILIPFSSVTGHGRDDILEILEECCEYAESAERN